ncbi:MAG: DUF2267 domain-containing protein [Bacteroidetes bacterium]|jgi:uncharacterized protein (DUF2267 family)|nr:DUF2267 domain-containing protein [Bacteroidota bacterium]
MNGQVNFEKTANEATSWVQQIAKKAGQPDRPDWALSALKSVLQTLRDRTPLQEVFHLSAQMPVLIRGLYFEGYKPTGKPDKMNAKQFLERIESDLGENNEISAEQALYAVLNLLYEKISEGEMEDIRRSMPADIQKLWAKSIRPGEALVKS